VDAVRGMTDSMTIGQRVAFYRRRRGLTQSVLAGLTGRTVDWLRKIENGRAPLDRLSVIRELAHVLDVALQDLIGEPVLMDWLPETRSQNVPALRVALMDHRQFLATSTPAGEQVDLRQLGETVSGAWHDYQESNYGRLSQHLPGLITDTHSACEQHNDGSDQNLTAQRLNACAHALAVGFLTKIGEGDLACIAATQGLTAAHASGSELLIGSLYRSVGHALLSIGEYDQAVALISAAANRFDNGLATASPEYLSVHGMLHLVGAVAASRRDDRATTTAFLAEADESARRLGHDANHLWTAFGPTNVAIHRVTAAMELGDLQIAVALGPRIDTTLLPVERRVRHSLETARALTRWNQVELALDLLLAAEHDAPEQVRYHQLSRLLIRELINRPRPPRRATELAHRMRVDRDRPYRVAYAHRSDTAR
jgi:transcriptional regulator with XRE-family HTH domain